MKPTLDLSLEKRTPNSSEPCGIVRIRDILHRPEEFIGQLFMLTSGGTKTRGPFYYVINLGLILRIERFGGTVLVDPLPDTVPQDDDSEVTEIFDCDLLLTLGGRQRDEV